MAGATLPAHAMQASINNVKFTHPLDINNTYFPLVPGTTFIYQGKDANKSTYEEFVVTNQTKTIQGVETRVVHDTNWTNGKITEDTFDWYAQDDAGNVWYFGEDSSQIKNGKVIGHAGSWEAGVNGASAGIIMEAKPKVGDTYQQEFAQGVAEDTATVLSLNESICVAYGCFSNVVKIKEFTPLEPGVIDNKYYAPGVGPEIKGVTVQGGSEQYELVNVVTN
jgi:hypothetical protein